MTPEAYFNLAAEEAKNSLCLRAKCGAILVADGIVIGRGYNSPAGGEPNRCNDQYLIPENNKYDITCCPHAEVRAIHNALIDYPDKVPGSDLYFMRIDDAGNNTFAGVPFCTMCSKEALDAGVSNFGLWHGSGIKIYPSQEYNDLSYQFFKDKNLWPLK